MSANNTLAQDDVIEHRYGALRHVYTTNHTLYYDLTGLGFENTAQRLAREIPSNFVVSSYMDLGTGSNLTARAYIRPLSQLGAESEVIIVDVLEDLLTDAKKKLKLAWNVASKGAPKRLFT